MEGVIPERLANLLYLIPPLGAELAEPFRHHVFHCHTITTGEGFSNIVGSYIAQRLSICGFMVFNNVHFYDYMLFRDTHHLPEDQDAPPVMFAVSQSGETAPVLNDVRHARQNGHRIVTFTKRSDSTLARMSDIVFVVDGSKQTLAGSLPNTFFGHVILAFEELVAFYFDGGHR